MNSVWSEVDGHVLEGGDQGRGLFEGCYFENVAEIASGDHENQLLSINEANGALCEASLGRACLPNGYSNSGTFDIEDSGFLGDFVGLTVPPVESWESVKDQVIANAGIGKI